MRKTAWLLLVLMVLGMAVVLAPQPAAAQEVGGGGYPDVAALEPFSAASNYMSLPGYLRWMTFVEQKVWLSVPEAKRIVAEQVGGR
jgi:hypothetical protein